MDWGTHIVLAAKVLESCNLDKGAAIYSVLPVIDSKPAHFHRVYAHILENQPPILDAAMDIFSTKEIADRDYKRLGKNISKKVKVFNEELKLAQKDNDENATRLLEKNIYAYTRIGEITPTFIEHVNAAADLTKDTSVSKISNNKLAAGVALISHTYYDMWNNPVQVFLPESSLCSAQWNFWEQLDYMKFRGEFYKTENIIPFRKEILKSKTWDIKLKPEALIKAMIIRIGEMAQPALKYEVIDNAIRVFMRYMNISGYQRVDTEIDFCRMQEKEIEDIILNNYGKDI